MYCINNFPSKMFIIPASHPRCTVKFLASSSEVKMSEQDQRDKHRPFLQAAQAGAEPLSAISLDVLQRLLGSQLSQTSSRFSSMLKTNYNLSSVSCHKTTLHH